MKKFSSWPTFPQVYINGEFVGGCDIILQMHQNGELIDELKKVGITSALLEKAVNDKTNKSCVRAFIRRLLTLRRHSATTSF